MIHIRPGLLLTVALLSQIFWAWGCGEDPSASPEPETTGPDSAVQEDEPAAAEPAVHYERSLVFLGGSADSVLVVPWAFHTHRSGTTEMRERGVWLARQNSWERLTYEADTTRTAPAPWRVLPGESIRLVVGEGDRIQSLLFREGGREMETSLGIILAEWTGAGREMIRFHRGTLGLPSGTSEGFLADLVLSWNQDPGDWIFLQGGDRFQALLVEDDVPEDPTHRGPGATYRAWTRMAVREARWPGVEVTWEELRAFEPARRDIPGRWIVESRSGEITGELDAEGSSLSVGEGDGPILPLHGFFQVRGEIRMEGESFAVTGIIAHRQH